MSYLQALNAGLLESADNVETLATVLSNGNTSSSSINLTGTGSLNLTGTGDIALTSGDITLTSGDITLTSGDITLTTGDINLTSGSFTLDTNASQITGISGQLNIQANSFINLESSTKLTSGPLGFTYSTLALNSSMFLSGGVVSYSNVSTIALNSANVWTQLYLDNNVINAGVYMLSVYFSYNASVVYAVGNGIFFGIANIGSITPEYGLVCASVANVGYLNMTVPFVSTGSSSINNVVQFVYSTNMPSVSVQSINWTLTRVG